MKQMVMEKLEKQGEHDQVVEAKQSPEPHVVLKVMSLAQLVVAMEAIRMEVTVLVVQQTVLLVKES